jgi:hypothetical protein
MSILDTIRSSLRSILGGGEQSDSTQSDRSHTEGQVSVERETREAADASTESAIKGTDDAAESANAEAAGDGDSADADADSGSSDADADSDSADAEQTADADAAAAGTDAAASTGALVDEEAGKEPAEVVTSPSDDEREIGDDETAGDGTDADTSASDGAAASDDDRSVQTLKGIGPAYGERLGNAGIETVGDLAGADSERVAAEIDISEKRVTGWIERAREES